MLSPHSNRECRFGSFGVILQKVLSVCIFKKKILISDQEFEYSSTRVMFGLWYIW